MADENDKMPAPQDESIDEQDVSPDEGDRQEEIVDDSKGSDDVVEARDQTEASDTAGGEASSDDPDEESSDKLDDSPDIDEEAVTDEEAAEEQGATESAAEEDAEPEADAGEQTAADVDGREEEASEPAPEDRPVAAAPAEPAEPVAPAAHVAEVTQAVQTQTEQETGDQTPEPAEASGISRLAEVRNLLKRLSLTQLLLLSNTVVVLVLVIFIMARDERKIVIISGEQGVQVVQKQATDEPNAAAEESSVSWKQARDAYADGDYQVAMNQFRLLHKRASETPGPDVMADFFELRIAQCLGRLAKPEQSRTSLEKCVSSDSPIIRGVANYHLAMIDNLNHQYRQARLRGYLAIAALAAVDGKFAVEADCDFLIARTLTQEVLRISGRGGDVPWTKLRPSDPFASLDAVGLQELLGNSAGDWQTAVLAPSVKPVESDGIGRLWTATCSRSPLAELLEELAGRAGFDLQWDGVDEVVRSRPVKLYCRWASYQRLCEMAAGSVGLIARFTGDAVIVRDPTVYESLDEQRKLLTAEASSAWRRIFLRGESGDRVAEGHFALALLAECSSDTVAAIRDYEQTVSRFPTSPVAPLALLQGAKLRIKLRDYAGARQGLTDLLDSYPNCRESGQAYAVLGEATLKAGAADEAFKIFRKLYYMHSSAESRAIACFGMGKSLFQLDRHFESAQWLTRYINSIKDSSYTANVAEAYLLLGKCHIATGDVSSAATAFRLALGAGLTSDRRVDAIIELGNVLQSLGELPMSLVVLSEALAQEGDDQRKYRILVMTAELYRRMELPDMGASFLRGKMSLVADHALKAQLKVHLALCYRDAERLIEAYETMSEVLHRLSTGEFAYRSACDMAEICVAINKPAEAVAIARSVLDRPGGAKWHGRARKILAEAHLAGGEYEKAALALAQTTTGKPGVKR